MVQDQNSAPRVAPSSPKGSGRRAPWVILAIVLLAAVVLIISIAVAVVLLRA